MPMIKKSNNVTWTGLLKNRQLCSKYFRKVLAFNFYCFPIPWNTLIDLEILVTLFRRQTTIFNFRCLLHRMISSRWRMDVNAISAFKHQKNSVKLSSICLLDLQSLTNLRYSYPFSLNASRVFLESRFWLLLAVQTSTVV